MIQYIIILFSGAFIFGFGLMSHYITEYFLRKQANKQQLLTNEQGLASQEIVLKQTREQAGREFENHEFEKFMSQQDNEY